MGNRTSKAAATQKTAGPIIYQSSQPVPNTKFTQAFLNNLQGIPNTESESLPHGYSSDAEFNDMVSDRVQRELDMLQQQRLTMEKRGADQVRREVQDLLGRQQMYRKTQRHHVNFLNRIPVPVPDYAALTKEDQIMSCYKANPGRVLNCYKEVEDFKALSQKVKQEFLQKLAMLSSKDLKLNQSQADQELEMSRDPAFLEILEQLSQNEELKAKILANGEPPSEEELLALLNSVDTQQANEDKLIKNEVTPNPAFVVKTLLKEKKELYPAGLKVFINITHHPSIPSPPFLSDDEVEKAITTADYKTYRVPTSLAGPSVDTDKNGKLCLVYSTCFNSCVLKKASQNPQYRLFLIKLSMEHVAIKESLVLNIDDFALPKMTSKGKVSKHVIARALKPVIIDESEPIVMERKKKKINPKFEFGPVQKVGDKMVVECRVSLSDEIMGLFDKTNINNQLSIHIDAEKVYFSILGKHIELSGELLTTPHKIDIDASAGKVGLSMKRKMIVLSLTLL